MAELPLDQLIAEAEAGRQLQICNACRYCEGFCAVFPAMARRLEFPTADIHYLANLCHNCGACLYACQYAPPHEFAVNVPRALAQVRGRTYRHYAWPAACGRLYERNGLTVALALAAGLALFLAPALQINGTLWATAAGGNFYAVLPHRLMAAVFSAVSACACVALGIGVLRFWRDVSPGAASAVAVQEATRNVLQLTYLDGGHGQGCNDNSDAWTRARRRWHHVTFYGFVLCGAATGVASLYHYLLDWPAPYGWTTLPKLLGAAGGVGLLAGPLGLAWLHRRRNPQQGDPAQVPMDLGFMALLFAISLSGFALVLGRAGAAMPLLLCIHLGAVLALFATMPYGKFAHGIYRSAALLQWAIERRLPTRLGLKSD